MKQKSSKLSVFRRAGVLSTVAAACVALSVGACSVDSPSGPRLLGPYVLKSVNGQSVPMAGSAILSENDTVPYSVHSGTIWLDPSNLFTVRFKGKQDVGLSTARDIVLPAAGKFKLSSGDVSFFSGDTVNSAMSGSISGDTLTLRNAFLGMDAVFVRHPF